MSGRQREVRVKEVGGSERDQNISSEILKELLFKEPKVKTLKNLRVSLFPSG